MAASLQSRRAFLIAASAAAAAPRVAAGQALQEIAIGLPSTSLGAAMPRLTHEMGFYAKHGLQARLTVLESAAVATAALVSGSVKMIQAGPAELIAAQANGQKVVALGTAYTGLAQSLVLSKAAAAKVGVSPTAPVAQRLKALENLTVASTSATAGASVALRLAAAKLAGVTIRFTYISQPNFAPAMERGAIDAFIGSAPFSTFGVTKGLGVMWVNGPKGDLPAEVTPANAGLIMVMRDYADANPDVIRRLRGALGEFSKAVEERPAEVKATIARLFPDLDPPTLDLFYASESQAWRFKLPTVQEMAHEIRFVRDSGLPLPSTERLDPASTIYP